MPISLVWKLTPMNPGGPSQALLRWLLSEMGAGLTILLGPNSWEVRIGESWWVESSACEPEAEDHMARL